MKQLLCCSVWMYVSYIRTWCMYVLNELFV